MDFVFMGDWERASALFFFAGITKLGFTTSLRR